MATEKEVHPITVSQILRRERERHAEAASPYRKIALKRYRLPKGQLTIDVDADAIVEIGEDGAWVQAWVWIDDADLEA
jgi:hypothetical protein